MIVICTKDAIKSSKHCIVDLLEPAKTILLHLFPRRCGRRWEQNIHTYIHTYINTYIHIYIYLFMCVYVLTDIDR